MKFIYLNESVEKLNFEDLLFLPNSIMTHLAYLPVQKFALLSVEKDIQHAIQKPYFPSIGRVAPSYFSFLYTALPISMDLLQIMDNAEEIPLYIDLSFASQRKPIQPHY